MFKIMHKDQSKHILFATGFFSLERARDWIKNFNPTMYTDKTLKREDLEIIAEYKNPLYGGKLHSMDSAAPIVIKHTGAKSSVSLLIGFAHAMGQKWVNEKSLVSFYMKDGEFHFNFHEGVA